MAKEAGKSIVNSIKDRIKQSGSGGGNSWYLKDGQKRRVRFISDMEEAITIKFHSQWQKYFEPCYKYFGLKCKHCKDSDDKSADFYAWTVYDYEKKERCLFLYKAANTTPVPAMVDMFEAYGTILDRDYTISRKGEGTNQAYGLVPLDKTNFKKKDIKPLTKKEIMEMLKNQYNIDVDDDEDDEDDEDDDEPVVKKKTTKKKAPPVDDEDEEEEDEDEDEDDELAKKKSSKKPVKKAPPVKAKKKVIEEDEDEDEDEEEDDEDEDDEPPKKSKKPVKKAPPKKKAPAKKSKSYDDDDDEDDEEDDD